MKLSEAIRKGMKMVRLYRGGDFVHPGGCRQGACAIGSAVIAINPLLLKNNETAYFLSMALDDCLDEWDADWNLINMVAEWNDVDGKSRLWIANKLEKMGY